MPNAADVMTPNPVCCTPDTPLVEAARMMREGGFGIVPVVESREAMRLVGVLTDRDIVVRAIAEDRDLRTTTAGDVLTRQVRTVSPDASLDECRSVMEGAQVRRVPVVGANGSIVGMVSLSDLSSEVAADRLGATLEQISEPDTRQLYAEVMEGNSTAGTITPVADPTTSHRVKGKAA